jgi:site-specific recombinase XerD
MSVFSREEKSTGLTVWYIAYYPRGKAGPYVRRRLPPTVTTRVEAEEWEARFKGAMNGGSQELTEPSGSTIAELWPQYTTYARLHRLPRTADDVANAGRHFTRIIGGTHVLDIVEAHLDLYKESRKLDGVKNRTINKELAWLSGFLKWCRKHAHIVPSRKLIIERLPSKRPVPLVLSLAEVGAILQAAAPKHRAFLALLYFIGLRLSEVSGLRWEDIDYENGILRVTGKGDVQRLEPVEGFVLAFLDPIKPDPPAGYIFVTGKGAGRPLYQIHKTLRKLALQVGITKRVHPHLFRHSLATQLVEEGENLRVIQELLGHADIRTTRFYTHISMAHKKRASGNLVRAFRTVNNEEQPDEEKARKGKGK